MTDEVALRVPFWEGQLLHLGGCAALAAVVAWVAAPVSDALALALASAVAHQAWVLVGWRLELGRGILSRWFGRAAFPVFALGFAVLFASRFVALVHVSRLDAGALQVPDALRWSAIGIAALLLAWLAHTVHRHFGLLDGMGTDHFFAARRQRAPVHEGIYRFVPNAMYVVGFLPFWAIALAWSSYEGLLAAAYHHACIWLHYHGTERPDLERMRAAAPRSDP